MNKDPLDFRDPAMLRRIAEEKLNEKKIKAEPPILELNEKKLLFELQVHQIELEMQNEELLDAYQTAEKALKKYTMMYDFAPMGYFTLDADANICELNFTGADMLNDKRFSLINSNFKMFVAEVSLPEFNAFFEKMYTSHTKESCEIMLGYERTTPSYVYMEGVVTGDENSCLLSVVDISNFKKQQAT